MGTLLPLARDEIAMAEPLGVVEHEDHRRRHAEYPDIRRGRQGQGQHDGRHEQHRPLEDADQDQVAALVVARELRAQLADPPLEVLVADEDLPDFLAGRRASASER